MEERIKGIKLNLETGLLLVVALLLIAVLCVLTVSFFQPAFFPKVQSIQPTITAIAIKQIPPTWTPIPTNNPYLLSVNKCLLTKGDLPFYMNLDDDKDNVNEGGDTRIVNLNFSIEPSYKELNRPYAISQLSGVFSTPGIASETMNEFLELGKENFLKYDFMEGREVPANADEVKFFIGFADSNSTNVVLDTRLAFRQGKFINMIDVFSTMDTKDPTITELSKNQVKFVENLAKVVANRCH